MILGTEREEIEKPEFTFPKKIWKWRIDCAEGKWELCATGYRQIVRKPPELHGKQRLTYEQRGGYVLSSPT
jgi:hypothetical protein